MKKAFTLIEVMIAVFIFFIVVFSIMNIISNNRHLINLILRNNAFALKASLAFLNPDYKNNYVRVKDFNITNPYVIDILKKDNIKIKTFIDTKNDLNVSGVNTNIILKKVKAYDKYHSITIYSLGLE